LAREWAVHLDDVMVRRTSWHYYFADAAAKARSVADWMGELQAWSAERHGAELRRYECAVGISRGTPPPSSHPQTAAAGSKPAVLRT